MVHEVNMVSRMGFSVTRDISMVKAGPRDQRGLTKR